MKTKLDDLHELDLSSSHLLLYVCSGNDRLNELLHWCQFVFLSRGVNAAITRFCTMWRMLQ